MRSNIYVIKDNYAQMIIESQKYGIKRVKIDIEDIDKCKKYQWHYANSKDVPYIATRINGKYIRLHRYIYENVDDGLVVDHINRNSLDNRKINLRVSTYEENAFNRSLRADNKTGYSGVLYKEKQNKYQARIKFKGKCIHLGYFNSFEEAIINRQVAERILFGDFSPTERLIDISEDILLSAKNNVLKRLEGKIA